MLPSRFVEKAICVPSADQTGSRSSDGVLVSCCSPLPSQFITYRSKLPVRLDAKTIFWPLRLSRGSMSVAGVTVRRSTLLPSPLAR